MKGQNTEKVKIHCRNLQNYLYQLTNLDFLQHWPDVVSSCRCMPEWLIELSTLKEKKMIHTMCFYSILYTNSYETRLSVKKSWSSMQEIRRPLVRSCCTILYILWATAVTVLNPRPQGVVYFPAGGKHLVVYLFPLWLLSCEGFFFFWCGKLVSAVEPQALTGRNKITPSSCFKSCCHERWL